MATARVRYPRVCAALLVGTLLGASACGEGPLTGPDAPAVEAARTPTGGGGGPRVSATDPDTGFRNTTINVQVLGSGFDQGSKATWALNGDTTFATTKVKTNSTQYVSSKKLIANITIGADAPLDLYDVVVLTAGGKKGIGLELFAVSYQLTDLGTLGGAWSDVHGINDLGHVVGMSLTAAGEKHAFLWTPETGMQDLGTLGGTSSEAFDVNESGQVVGYRNAGGASLRAFVWTAAEGMRDLDLFGGSTSLGVSISAAGDVGGRISTLPGASLRAAVLWTAGGYELVDGVDLSAWGVNDLNGLGQAVGWVETASGTGPTRPFLYTRGAGGWTRFEIPAGRSSANAAALNASGQVTGNFRREDGGISGYTWSAAAGLDTLPALVPDGTVDPFDINDAGVPVGFVTGSGGALEKPAMWSPRGDGTWVLNLLPAGDNNHGYARAINNRGDIAGSVHTPSGLHAVLWSVK